MLQILSWNIRQGGGTRVMAISNALVRQNPEIIVLSEYQNNKNGQLIRNKLLESRYIHQAAGNDLSGGNTVLLASKIPFHLQHCQEADSKYKYSILKAEFDAFNLYGMYLPHKKKHKLFNFLVEEVQREKPSVLVGDFNTGINYIDQKGKSFMYTDYLDKLKTLGMVDAFREKYGDVKEYSCYFDILIKQ